MAVDLRLNRFVRHSPPQETEFQRLERRARERTYLVLFVHDRALSMQCNKQWMLPECDLIRNADNWHERNETGPIRPEDVIIAAFVSLRRIAVRFFHFIITTIHYFPCRRKRKIFSMRAKMEIIMPT
jgi:hypothetical protein